MKKILLFDRKTGNELLLITCYNNKVYKFLVKLLNKRKINYKEVS